MDSSTKRISPLRQRILDDMRMRKLSEKTQSSYIRGVCQLATFLGRSPDSATVEDLRRFQLHLVDRGTSPITLNATITALKFFFEVTLDRGELMARMQPVYVPRRLPVVLSREEVARLILHAPAPDPPQPEVNEPKSATTPPTFVCAHCGCAMLILHTFARANANRAPPHE